MKRAVTILAAVAMAAVAGQYATLKNGKTIILNDNGTWEEVSLTAPAAAKAEASPFVAPQPVAAPAVRPFADDPTAKAMIGVWSANGIRYEFKADGTVMMSGSAHEGSYPYVVTMTDTESRTVWMSVNELDRLGKLSFGGFNLTVRLSKDGKSLTDITDPMVMNKSALFRQ